MRLLIWVNKFDENDDLLGFFVGWVKELTQYLDGVIVVAQHIGKYEQMPRLKVILIDKHQIPNPIGRVFRFISLLLQQKKDYNGVLVIMAPAWAIMASLATKILGKRLYLWYAVWRGNWKLRLAEKLVNKVFCSVPETFPFKTAKLIAIGQGIDADYFSPEPGNRKSNHILFLGRISPIKKIEVLLRAFSLFEKNNPGLAASTSLDIVGDTANEGDRIYLAGLKKIARELNVTEKLKWFGRVPHSQARANYREADIFINLTPTGSFDKTMLEAMACGGLVLASNESLGGFMRPELRELLIFKQNDPRDLAQKLSRVLNLSADEKEKLRNELRGIVTKHHSQKQWAENLIKNL